VRGRPIPYPSRSGRPQAAWLACLILVGVLTTLAVPARAQGAWSAPIGIAGMQWRAGGQSVAVDPKGNAVFVWAELTSCGGNSLCSRIKSRVRSSAGVFSPIKVLSEPDKPAEGPSVAVDSNGNAIFVWRGPLGSVQARVRSAAGVLGPIETLGKGYYPQVAVDRNGNAVFVWHGAGGYVRTRVRSAAGTLSAAQTVAGPGALGFPQLAVDPNGNAVFVWTRRDETTDCGGEPCERIQTRARSAAGRLSATQTLSAPGVHADSFSPTVGIDANGNAVFVWRFCCYRVQARARSATGVLSARQTLSATEVRADHPDVAVDPNGNAVFVWRHCGTSFCDTPWSSRGMIETISRSATGALSSTQTLSTAGHSPSPPRVAVDAGGNAVFVWQSWDHSPGCGGDGCIRVQARVRSAAGALHATQDLSMFTVLEQGPPPRIAVTPGGKAIAFWGRASWQHYVNFRAATGP
jgi:DNA-binding beta-propeller fold protein YncE